MDDGRRQWIGLAVLVGITYAVIGVVFAWPAAHVRAWRLAAWLVSAALFAGHIAYERLGLGNPSRRAALHVAVSVAIGAFGLAVGAVVHSLLVGSSSAHHRLVLIALVVWPVITGVPAFLVAFVAGEVLAWWPRRARPD
jgi:hypothetical protein